MSAYKVRSGDTLFEIARDSLPPGAKHGDIMAHVRQVAAMNGISDINRINAGQDLLLEGAGPSVPSPPGGQLTGGITSSAPLPPEGPRTDGPRPENLPPQFEEPAGYEPPPEQSITGMREFMGGLSNTPPPPEMTPTGSIGPQRNTVGGEIPVFNALNPRQQDRQNLDVFMENAPSLVGVGAAVNGMGRGASMAAKMAPPMRHKPQLQPPIPANEMAVPVSRPMPMSRPMSTGATIRHQADKFQAEELLKDPSRFNGGRLPAPPPVPERGGTVGARPGNVGGVTSPSLQGPIPPAPFNNAPIPPPQALAAPPLPRPPTMPSPVPAPSPVQGGGGGMDTGALLGSAALGTGVGIPLGLGLGDKLNSHLDERDKPISIPAAPDPRAVPPSPRPRATARPDRSVAGKKPTAKSKRKSKKPSAAVD